jgi:hypothetical protein
LIRTPYTPTHAPTTTTTTAPHWGLISGLTCQSRFYVGFDVQFMCILCALDVPLFFFMGYGVGPKPGILCEWGF